MELSDRRPLLVVLSGPSGVGKSTVAERLLADPAYGRAVTATTRAPRPGEADADKYIKEYVEWGAGPRASQYMVLGAKSLALLNGKPAPSAADVKSVARSVLRHRIIPNYNASGEGIDSAAIVDWLLEHVREPDYRD